MTNSDYSYINPTQDIEEIIHLICHNIRSSFYSQKFAQYAAIFLENNEIKDQEKYQKWVTEKTPQTIEEWDLFKLKMNYLWLKIAQGKELLAQLSDQVPVYRDLIEAAQAEIAAANKCMDICTSFNEQVKNLDDLVQACHQLNQVYQQHTKDLQKLDRRFANPLKLILLGPFAKRLTPFIEEVRDHSYLTEYSPMPSYLQLVKHF